MSKITNLINLDNQYEYGEAIRKWKKPIIIVAVILVILIIAATIIANIIANKKDYDIVNVTNYSELTQKPPAETKEHFDSELYNLINRHFDIKSHGSAINATIRPDSISNNLSKNIKSVEYILDVDEYRQSYYVNMAWSNAEEVGEDISIECVPRDQSKYPDDICYGRYYSTNSAMSYLPYSGQSPSENSFEAKYYGKNNDIETITITVSGCDELDSSNRAIAETKDYLEEVSNVDVNQLIFRKELDYSNCN